MGVSLWCYFVHAHHPWNQKKRHRSSEAVVVWALAMLRRRTTLIRNLLALAEPGYIAAVSVSAMPVPSRSPFTPSPKASRRWPWTSSGTEAATLPTAMPRTTLALVCKLYRRHSGRGNTAWRSACRSTTLKNCMSRGGSTRLRCERQLGPRESVPEILRQCRRRLRIGALGQSSSWPAATSPLKQLSHHCSTYMCTLNIISMK